jgi:hypothetical protein
MDDRRIDGWMDGWREGERARKRHLCETILDLKRKGFGLNLLA